MENLDDPFAIQITISLFLFLSLEENHLSISPGAYTEQTYRKTFSLSDPDLYFVISLLFCFHMSWRWPWWCRYCQVKAFWAFNIMVRYHNLGQHPRHFLITTTDKKLSTSNKSLQIQFHLQANFCSIDLFCTQKLKSLVNLVLTPLFLQLMSMLYTEIEKWVTSID